MNNYRKFYNWGHFYNQNADQEIFTRGGGGGGSYLMCEFREKGSRGYETIPIHGKFKHPYFNKVELQKIGLGRTHPCPPENKIISQYISPLGKISWSAHELELICPFICLIDKKVTILITRSIQVLGLGPHT